MLAPTAVFPLSYPWTPLKRVTPIVWYLRFWGIAFRCSEPYLISRPFNYSQMNSVYSSITVPITTDDSSNTENVDITVIDPSTPIA